MSLLNQSYSPEFVAGLSSAERVTLLKAMIDEYVETHTKEEIGRLVAIMKAENSTEFAN